MGDTFAGYYNGLSAAISAHTAGYVQRLNVHGVSSTVHTDTVGDTLRYSLLSDRFEAESTTAN